MSRAITLRSCDIETTPRRGPPAHTTYMYYKIVIMLRVVKIIAEFFVREFQNDERRKKNVIITY